MSNTKVLIRSSVGENTEWHNFPQLPPQHFRVTFDVLIDRDEWLQAQNKPAYIASVVADKTIETLKRRGDIWK